MVTTSGVELLPAMLHAGQSAERPVIMSRCHGRHASVARLCELTFPAFTPPCLLVCMLLDLVSQHDCCCFPVLGALRGKSDPPQENWEQPICDVLHRCWCRAISHMRPLGTAKYVRIGNKSCPFIMSRTSEARLARKCELERHQWDHMLSNHAIPPLFPGKKDPILFPPFAGPTDALMPSQAEAMATETSHGRDLCL